MENAICESEKNYVGLSGICLHGIVGDGILSSDTGSVRSLLSEQRSYDYFLHRINYWNGILYIDTVDMQVSLYYCSDMLWSEAFREKKR